MSHRSVMAFAEWASQAFGFDNTLVLGGQTPLFFSMSVFDIYQTLYNCGSMYIIPGQMFSFPMKLLEFLDDNGINTIYWVPSALCIIADSGALDTCSIIRVGSMPLNRNGKIDRARHRQYNKESGRDLNTEYI